MTSDSSKIENQLEDHHHQENCYIYWCPDSYDYLLSRTEKPESAPIIVDRCPGGGDLLYYIRNSFLEGEEAICHVSNSKERICESLYDSFEFEERNGKVYYITDEEFVCSDHCSLKTKEDVIKCMMKHNTEQYEILELV
jgi:hypothetical protein